MKKISLFFLPLILLISFLLGSRMILSGDFFYLFDQARDYLLVRDVVDNHTLMLIGNQSGLGGFFHGPLWIYMLVPFFILSNGDPFGLAYFYISLQLLIVLVAYLVGSKLYGAKGGILISLLVALSPAIWRPVPNTVGANMEPLVYLALFYCIVSFLRGNSKFFIFVSFFTGLTLQFEAASSLVLIPSVILLFFLNKTAVKSLKVIILSFISFFLSLSTFILFDFRHNFLMSNALLGAFSEETKRKGYLELSDRLINHMNSLFGVYKNLLFKQDLLFILLLVIIFILAVALIVKRKINPSAGGKKEFLVLLLFPVLPFVFFMLYPYPIWPEYVFGLLIPVTFAFYLAIITVWKNILGKILIMLFFTLTFFHVSIFIQNNYLENYPQSSSSGSYKNQKAVVDWIFKDARRGKFGYFVYSPSTFTHGMDYLISWEAKSYSGKIPTTNKESTTYLILYPHMANDEGAYDFWKKNTLKTNGQIILTKEFNGGIIVEKLLITTNESDVDQNYYQGLIFR